MTQEISEQRLCLDSLECNQTVFKYCVDIMDNHNKEASIFGDLKERNFSIVCLWGFQLMQKRCYYSWIIHRYSPYSITVLLLIFHLFVLFFSSKWDQVVSLLVPKPQNFTEQKMSQTDLKTQVCDPKSCHSILATHW